MDRLNNDPYNINRIHNATVLSLVARREKAEVKSLKSNGLMRVEVCFKYLKRKFLALKVYKVLFELKNNGPDKTYSR